MHSIPNVRFITVLRDPISQTLSWEAMWVSQKYYQHYPRKDCPSPRSAPILPNRPTATLKSWLKSMDHCIDNPFRKNVTMMLVANAVASFQKPANSANHGFPGMAVTLSAQWLLGKPRLYSRITGKSMINYLKNNYFLVGVTDYLDEFLVLLALHMGWDPSALYYEHCKPTIADVRQKDFAIYFPELMPKLIRSTAPMMETYEWAKKEFESYISQLGPWFHETVAKYKAGLKEYQEARQNKERPYLWKPRVYRDGHKEDC